jgi:hypothetical protein
MNRPIHVKYDMRLVFHLPCMLGGGSLIFSLGKRTAYGVCTLSALTGTFLLGITDVL